MSTAPPIALLPGEQVLQHVEFSPRLILKHLKVTMILTDARLYVSEPHTILGFIPHGYYAHAAPLECISDVQSGNRMSTRQATYGAMMFVAAFVLMGGIGNVGMLPALILCVVGLALILTSRKLSVVARTFGSGVLAGDAGSSDLAAIEMMQNAVFIEAMNARARRGRAPSADSSPNIQIPPQV